MYCVLESITAFNVNVFVKIFTRAAWYNRKHGTDMDSDWDTCAALLAIHYERHVNTQAARPPFLLWIQIYRVCELYIFIIKSYTVQKTKKKQHCTCVYLWQIFSVAKKLVNGNLSQLLWKLERSFWQFHSQPTLWYVIVMHYIQSDTVRSASNKHQLSSDIDRFLQFFHRHTYSKFAI